MTRNIADAPRGRPGGRHAGAWTGAVVATAVALFSAAPARAECKPQFGVTYTHFKYDPKAVCKNGGDAARAATPGAIIPQYDKPEVRDIVRGQLAQMRANGVDIIRTVLWFTQDRIPVEWGQLKAPLSPADAARIKAFGEDIRAAGFRSWLLVTVPGVGNGPICRKQTWGDCFDASRQQTNFGFIRSVHDLLAPLGRPNFKLEYDISGELCPSRYLGPLANKNIASYLTELLRWYSTEVSATDFRISCGGLSDDRMAGLLQIYDAAGVKPNVVDLHFYDTTAAAIAPKLLPAARMARERHVPFVIGELLYEDPDQLAAIASLAKTNNICPSAIIEWPLRGRNMCQFDVSPPYDPRLARSTLGGAK